MGRGGGGGGLGVHPRQSGRNAAEGDALSEGVFTSRQPTLLIEIMVWRRGGGMGRHDRVTVQDGLLLQQGRRA